MTVVDCPRCGSRFETAARSGRTRCGNCRAAVTVPGATGPAAIAPSAEHRVALVRLTCGHPDAVVIHPGRSVRSMTSNLGFTCPDSRTTTAKVERVLAVFSESEWSELGEEQVSLLVEASRYSNASKS